MAFDQIGLNSLLTTLTRQNNLAALRKQRANLLQELQQKPSTGKTPGRQQPAGDLKQDVKKLADHLQQSAQEIYDQVSTRLERERLEREAAFAKNERTRARALARHEGFLETRSMSKLLSASGKANHLGAPSFSTLSHGSQGEKPYISEVDRELQESVKYGIAAADVAVRRKKAESKAQIEEQAVKKRATRRKKTKRINIMV